MEKLDFSLYHATSTLFIDSIKQNGLGAHNPVKELKLLELLKKIQVLMEEKLHNNEERAIALLSLRRITEQGSSESVNYQHGQTYLTPSRWQAGMYARNYGCEALDAVYEMTDILKKYDVFPALLEEEYKSVYKIKERNYQPIILRLDNVRIDYLAGEKNLPLQTIIDRVNKAREKDPELYETFVGQCNFRLIKPVRFAEVLVLK
jgi:hypothetical protein